MSTSSKFSLTSGPIGPFRNVHRKRNEIAMSNYLDVTTLVTGNNGKTRFHKVGVAFPQGDDSKAAMTIQLFATPTNGELVLFAPKAGTPDDQDGE